MDIRQQISEYTPFNEQEARDKELILRALKEDDIFFRTNVIAHMTASAWIVSPSFDQVLMCYHNIYHSWSWLGGHADGNEDLSAVALKEVREESGLKHLKLISPDIYSLESLTVNGHIKNGKYVSSHLHLNVTYLIQADDKEELHIKKDENSNLKWFTLKGAVEASTEPWFQEHIYTKLNAKLPLFLKSHHLLKD